ncbi:cytochrome b/b6 domain-containing protein [Paracoccus caeni]|uniref:Cytochrome b/b6 domain-containing protein n=1 Tax=Paracoccus caeni TaxID=657651 RepID=A0A934SCP0_9RHOB|nr:cytochrome b/b6 domain-containing protein [Paracoccus caeni]MBK4214884.1 cytochrome b/b6 domain-containing protein [Paracoccus caeni]
MSNEPAKRVRVWDPALRICHWLLAVLVIVNWCLGKFGPNVMTLHFWLGYAILSLLVFRVIWGFIGPAPARFSTFIPGPRALMRYLKGILRREPSNWPGHNPAGAISVIAILLVLGWQVVSGLMADPDDFINVGPLASAVGSGTARQAVGWHHLGANLILIFVLLHLAAILFYRLWKHEDLVRPMITGWKWVRRR